VLTQVRQLLAFARQQGYGRTEVIQMITDLPQDGHLSRAGRLGRASRALALGQSL
jgi:hypothetical protein